MQEFYTPDMTYMTSVYFINSNRNVMSQDGEGKVERVFKYKMISVQNRQKNLYDMGAY